MSNLEPIKSNYFMSTLDGNDFALTAEEISEELDGEAPLFARIRIPAGGITSFEVQGEGDETEMVKTLEGVIVHHHSANAYWTTNDTQNTPPDCSSMDGKRGVGNPGGPCRSCPYNAFGTGEGGKGKACKNMKQLYLLTEGNVFPYALSLPPTSLKKYEEYVSLTVNKGRKVCDVVTSISLIRKENSAGQPYSYAVFKSAGLLNEEDRQTSRSYRKTVKEFVAAGANVVPEYVPAEAVAVNESTGEVI